jgi:hypothetical protein
LLTFSKRWVEQIVSGQKNVTLRKWPKPLVKEGGAYEAKTNRFSKESFAKLRVTSLKQIQIQEITEEIARRDGYANANEAGGYWLKQGFPPTKLLWLLEFKFEK